MNRWVRFSVVLFVLLGLFCVGMFFVIRELDRMAGERAPDVFVNPVHDIRVGDWAEYRREGGIIERQEVVSVAELTYTLKVTSTMPDGSIHPSNPQTHAKMACGFGDRFVPVSYRRERVTIAGREWDAWRIEVTNHLVGKAVCWVSDEMPLGLLRRELVLRSVEKGGELNFDYIRHGHDDPD
jgi:hypothetical protein